MDVLRDEDALGYCVGAPAHRLDLWERAMKSAACPAYVLPIFELCRAIHFGARHRKRFDIGSFRDCWQDLVVEHETRSLERGSIVRLLGDGSGGWDNAPREVWARATVGSRSPADADGADPRDGPRDPRPLRECLRCLGDLALEAVAAEAEWERQWEHPLPDLPADLTPRRGPEDGEPTEDLVLDTNFFVDVLDELPENGRLLELPCQRGDSAMKLGGAARRFRRALQTRGASGHLIVPVTVLIEAFGIVRIKHREQHANADAVMRAIEIGGKDWPLWDAFVFQELSEGVLGAYLVLHEGMARHVPEQNKWPDFPDAFVLAHGLFNRCPVVSGEWTRKSDWNEVKRLFPHLLPR